MNVCLALESMAREHPERTAVVCGPMSLTYGELNAQASRLAHGLQAKGVVAGDRIAITCPSLPQFVISYYGILKLGAVAVPLNLLLKKDEIAYQLRDCSVKGYICFEGSEEAPLGRQGLAAFEASPDCVHFWAVPADGRQLTLLEGQTSWNELLANGADAFDSIPQEADSLCAITYTSGTTGVPKGALMTHGNEFVGALMIRDGFRIRPDDVVLSPMPLFSAWRCGIMHTTFLTGATLVLSPRFAPAETWQLMRQHKVTVFYGVPAMYFGMYHALQESGIDPREAASTWRLGVYGGAPFDLKLRRIFADEYGVELLQGYGLTETLFAVLGEPATADLPGAIGKPIPGVDVRVVDGDMNDMPVGEPGEIVLRSPTVMKGYWHNDAWTEEAFRGGWFHTGDVGRRDAEGRLFLLDRIKDMINRGGYKVYPAQVEQVLMQHPSVSGVAVVGIPDERLGEEVKAFVVPAKDAEIVPGDFIAWAREQLAGHAYPREVECVEQLPISPAGKVLRRLLREPQSPPSAN